MTELDQKRFQKNTGMRRVSQARLPLLERQENAQKILGGGLGGLIFESLQFFVIQ